MSGAYDFVWHWTLAKGHSGGLLLGVKEECYEVEEVNLDVHFIGCLVRDRLSNFRFWVLNVYGPAQHDLSAAFVQDLSDFCGKEILPILLGGDFNLIRSNRDKNQGQGDPRLMELFNDFIGNFQLRDLFIGGVKYTWSNKQKFPTLVKLDRILATTSWDMKYTNSYAWVKARIGSDHNGFTRIFFPVS
jgi:hypothetical protein